jgi:SNF2 family DNA or RNA helicase
MNFRDVMHGYQLNLIAKIIKNEHLGVFMDMGMGKTACILYAFKRLKQTGKANRMLIIAPKFVALNTWSDEINKWDDLSDLKINIAVGTENKRRDAFADQSDIVIINRENTTWMVKNISMKSFNVLCIDELSSFKNPISQRFKSISKVLKRFDYRLGLTGTPAPNGYLDLWSQMFIINPDILGHNYFAYRFKFFKEVIPYKWELIENGEEIISGKLKESCVSLLSSDWLDMPSKIENHIKIPMDSKCLKTYRLAVENTIYISSDKVVCLDANLTIKLQQLASGFIYSQDSSYFDTVHTLMIDKLDEIMDCITGNTLLFYNFRAEREIIMSKFDYARELKTSEDFHMWNKGLIRLAICHPNSIGYGLNLQAGGNNIIWYGYNWASDTVKQANARLYRQGQKNCVIMNYIYVENTIHERIRKVLDGKIKKQDLLMESVKYVEQILNL